ncbi:MAG: acetamidase/formamidase family protein, partial [Raoultibacter sp.]
DGKLIWNDALSIPLNPMIGVIGVAPQGDSVNCGTPGSHGGNMDNTAIAVGATVYFPVAADGALFGCGDMHAVMGDGEISVSGAEVAGYATVRLTALPEKSITNPLIENETHFGTIASAETLDEAAEIAVHDMVRLVHQATGTPEDELVMLFSLVADVKICQMVDPEKTIRFMVPKYVLETFGFTSF